MAQLKEIRSRITSIHNTRQVTSAMKMVSAAKLKKAQDAILQVLPYDQKLMEILQNLSEVDLENASIFTSKVEEVKNVLVVVIGANRGLCGAFNANVAKTAINHVEAQYKTQFQAGNVTFLPIGKQVEKELKIRDIVIEENANQLIEQHNYTEIAAYCAQIMESFEKGKFDRIDIVYNKFKNAAVQDLTVNQFLPIRKEESEDAITTKPDYILEPSEEELLRLLIPKSLKMRFYQFLLDSNAAEQGARMTAMHQATDNATDLLKELKTKYNNARQSAITNEILEITAGAEALNG